MACSAFAKPHSRRAFLVIIAAAVAVAIAAAFPTADASAEHSLTAGASTVGPPTVVATPDPWLSGAARPDISTVQVPSRLEEVPDGEALVEGLATEYSLPRSEAEDRIRWQAVTSDFSSVIPPLLDDAYGGGWVDNKDGGRVKIGVTASVTSAQLLAVEELLAERDVQGFTDIVTVDHSAQELNSLVSWLVERLGSVNAGASSPINAGIDHRRNTVILDIYDPASLSPAQSAAVDDIIARYGAMVSIEHKERFSQSRTTCSASDCNAPMRGGVRKVKLNATQFPCTTGFNARSRSDNLPYVLTAGHCIHNTTATWYSYRSGGQQLAVGRRHNFVFGHNQGDYGIIRNNHGHWPTSAFVLVHSGSDTTRDTRYPIRRTGFSEVGRRICYTGVGSLTKCGEIYRVNQSFDEDGITTVGLGMIKGPCGINGDSGGPAYAYGTAYGLMVAREQGWFNCYTYYQGITAAAHHMNVWVVTG